MSTTPFPGLEPAIHTIRIFCDGGSRGNPGPAGVGAVVLDASAEPPRLLASVSETIGIATNNVAEYNGLLAALRWAVDHGHASVRVKADSELLVKQMRGEYKVKNPGLQPLVAEARRLVSRLGRVTFEHVRREHNKDADRLSNVGMDEAEEALRNPPPPSLPGQGELF